MALQYELTVQDNGTATLKKFSGAVKDADKRAREAQSAFREMGANMQSMVTDGVAAVVGFKALKTMLIDSVTEADNAALATSQLERALGGSGKALIEQAQALSEKTRYDNDAIVKSNALMANFVGQENAIKRLTPLILDLATAKGIDLDTATMAVTKSVIGSAGALEKMGISASGAAGTSARLDSVISGLTRTVGGAAEVAGSAGAGGMVKFKNAMGDVQEEIGNAILPSLDFWSEKLTNLSHEWTEFLNEGKKADPSTTQGIIQIESDKVDELRNQIEETKARIADRKNSIMPESYWAFDIKRDEDAIKKKEELVASSLALIARMSKQARIEQARDREASEKPLVKAGGGDDGAAEKYSSQLKAAQELEHNLLLSTMDGNEKIEAEHIDHLSKITKLKKADQTSLLELEDQWYLAELQKQVDSDNDKLNANAERIKKEEEQESKANADAAQRDDESSEKRLEMAMKEASEKLAIFNSFYATDESNAIHSINVKAIEFRRAGVEEVEVAKWVADEKEKLRLKEATAYVQAANDAATSLAAVTSNLQNIELNNSTSKYDREKQQLDEFYSKKITAAQGDSAKQSALQTELANKEKVIETKKQAEMQKIKSKYAAATKSAAISQVVTSGALAEMSIYEHWAWNPPVIAALMALSGVATVTNAALVASQPAYAVGGLSAGGAHSITVGEKGPEYIVNASATRANLDLLEAMNRGVSRDDISKIAGGSGSQSITFIVQGGVINERFLNDTLIPAIESRIRKR